MRTPTRTLLVALLTGTVGCRLGDGPVVPPQLSVVSATINPLNNLSTLLEVKGSNVDSVRIVYTSADGKRSATPFSRLTGSITRLAALGLAPSTVYSHMVEAYGPGGEISVGPFALSSGPLPVLLSNVKLSISGTPTNGHLLTSLGLNP